VHSLFGCWSSVRRMLAFRLLVRMSDVISLYISSMNAWALGNISEIPS